MNNEKFKSYIIHTITLLKTLARKAKAEAENPKESSNAYAEGVLMGYYSIISLLKHQAFAFCIDQKELGLADIKPDIDLLGLHRNPDIDFEEDNWSVDVMSEERAQGYLSDSIQLLKDQAKEAKLDADHPKEGDSADFNTGFLMAYHQVIALMKNQAPFFDLSQEDIGLADIEPEKDLL